jgi:hypothetical protein
MFRPLVAACLAVVVVSSALAGGVLSEDRALAKAVAILKGDPYGTTNAEVIANIRERRLGSLADSACGGKAATWAFHVVVPMPNGQQDSPIDGWLYIDAHSGRMLCANLPMLD